MELWQQLLAGALGLFVLFMFFPGIKATMERSKNAEVRLAIKLKEMEELKMVALQSQMNPHFLFNSLISINLSIVICPP